MGRRKRKMKAKKVARVIGYLCLFAVGVLIHQMWKNYKMTDYVYNLLF